MTRPGKSGLVLNKKARRFPARFFLCDRVLLKTRFFGSKRAIYKSSLCIFPLTALV
jgi:hypothetical protein